MLMKYKVAAVFLFLPTILLLAGCYENLKPSGATYSRQVISTDQSRLILYRQGGGFHMRNGVPAVWIDSKMIGLLPYDGFIQIDLPEGKHQVIIQAYPKKVWGFKPVGKEIVSKNGAATFLELDITTVSGGVVTPIFGMVQSKVELKEVSISEAEQHLVSMRQAMPTDF